MLTTEILLADGSNLKLAGDQILLARYEPGQADRVLNERDARDLVVAQPAFYREHGLAALRAHKASSSAPVDLEAIYAGATHLADQRVLAAA